MSTAAEHDAAVEVAQPEAVNDSQVANDGSDDDGWGGLATAMLSQPTEPQLSEDEGVGNMNPQEASEDGFSPLILTSVPTARAQHTTAVTLDSDSDSPTLVLGRVGSGSAGHHHDDGSDGFDQEEEEEQPSTSQGHSTTSASAAASADGCHAPTTAAQLSGWCAPQLHRLSPESEKQVSHWVNTLKMAVQLPAKAADSGVTLLSACSGAATELLALEVRRSMPIQISLIVTTTTASLDPTRRMA
jgi:hypothetical protein